MTVRELVETLSQLEHQDRDVTINEIDTDNNEINVRSVFMITDNSCEDSYELRTLHKRTHYRDDFYDYLDADESYPYSYKE